MNIPTDILDRLLILNPAYEREDARKAIAGLYQEPQDWLSLCENFSIPRVHVKDWQLLALFGLDVLPHIAHYLDMIGVTEDVLRRYRSR